MQTEPLIYRIDENDKFTYINEVWKDFARDNKWPEAANHSILGRSLWDYISNAETIHIYQTVFQNVRKQNKTVRIPYRCDAPDRRRFMEMTIVPLNRDHLEFLNEILREEHREPVLLLDTDTQRNREMLVMCGWCKMVRVEENWKEVEDALQQMGVFNNPVLPRITHGICPSCTQQLRTQFAA